MRHFLLTALVFLLTLWQCAAQSLGTEIGVGLGTSIYQGDLSPHWLGAYNKPNLSLQVMAQQNLLPAFAIRLNYAYAPVRDNEENYAGGVHKLRNFSFNATIHEFSLQGMINPQFSNGDEEIGNIHPYFFGGIGVAFTSIQRDFSRFNRTFPGWQTWVLPGLTADSLTKLPTKMITLPVGMGVRFQIGDNVALYGEFTKRLVRSEYLDGFSKSANQKENDGFASFVIGIVLRRSEGGSGAGGIFGFGAGGIGGGGGYRGSGRSRSRTDCPKNVY